MQKAILTYKNILLWAKKNKTKSIFFGILLYIVINHLFSEVWFPYTFERIDIETENKVAENKYKWNKWSDSIGGQMAHDPKWFIMPSAKLQTKPMKYDASGLQNKNQHTYQSEFFRYVCKTEAVFLKNKNYIIKEDDSILYLRNNEQLIKKIPKDEKQKNEMIKSSFLNLNEKLNPNIMYSHFNQNIDKYVDKKVDFNLNILDEKDIKYPEYKDHFPKKSTFKDFLTHDGNLYRITFDKELLNNPNGDYKTLQKINISNAKYYSLWRAIERNDLKKYRIAGEESIIVDRINHKLVSYSKMFFNPSCTWGATGACDGAKYWGSYSCSDNLVNKLELDKLED